MNGNDLYNVLDKEPCPPMTFTELRGRLKHIAVCCIGLSIDLANEIQTRETLAAENEQITGDDIAAEMLCDFVVKYVLFDDVIDYDTDIAHTRYEQMTFAELTRRRC